jgi:hypothetical protein
MAGAVGRDQRVALSRSEHLRDRLVRRANGRGRYRRVEGWQLYGVNLVVSASAACVEDVLGVFVDDGIAPGSAD